MKFLIPGKNYTIRLYAYYAYNERRKISETVRIKIPLKIPPAPTNVVFYEEGEKIRVNWEPGGEEEVDGYLIFLVRGPGDGSSYTTQAEKTEIEIDRESSGLVSNRSDYAILVCSFRSIEPIIIGGSVVESGEFSLGEERLIGVSRAFAMRTVSADVRAQPCIDCNPNPQTTATTKVKKMPPSKPLPRPALGAVGMEGIDIDYTLFREGDNWSADVTKITGEYFLEVRELPYKFGGISLLMPLYTSTTTKPVTGPGPDGNTTEENYCDQVQSLTDPAHRQRQNIELLSARLSASELLMREITLWSMTNAIQAHEEVHEKFLINSFNGAKSDIEKTIESMLKIPYNSGETKAMAKKRLEESL